MLFIARPVKKCTIKKLASIIRSLIKISYNGKLDLVKFIENKLYEMDEDYNFQVVPVKDMPGVYGRANTSSNEIIIREDVYYGAKEGNPSDLFTLAHEIGHYFLHDISMVGLARGNVPKERQPELQAGVFAKELLRDYFKEMGIKFKDVIN